MTHFEILRRTAAALIISSLLSITPEPAWAEPLWQNRTPGDPALSLIALPQRAKISGSAWVAGYDSGAVVCYSWVSASDSPVLWKAQINGCVLDLLAMPDAKGDNQVIAATDTGIIASFVAAGPSAGKQKWRFDAVFNIAQLALMSDVDGDGVGEVAVGGADHRVHLLSGANGKPLWSRLFEGEGEAKYVEALASVGDLNGDRIKDLVVRTWSGHCWGISGADGGNLWNPRVGSRYASTIAAAADLNGDDIADFFQSGNDGILTLSGGKDGTELWRSPLGSPIRTLAVTQTQPAKATVNCFAGTAAGKVVVITGQDAASLSLKWTAEMGDVCRKILAMDLDRDDNPDVVAGAENGSVCAFAGADGKQLWRWQGQDTVRTMTALGDLNSDGVPEIAAALLDGTLVVLPGQPKQNATSEQGQVKKTAHTPSVVRFGTKTTNTSPDVAEVPILLYHDVPPGGVDHSDPSPLDYFRQQMDLLVSGGYNAVSLDDVAEWLEGKRLLPPKPVCITFDGQYASHLTHVAKVLQERGFFAISYITTDWIGTVNHLDWHQLRKLEQTGVMQIENHTSHHRFLPMLNREEALDQIETCKKAIHAHLDGKVSRHHAYPDGAHSSTARDVLRQSGFRTGTSVQSRRATRTDNPFALPRYAIAEDMSLDSFKMIIGYQPSPYPALPYKCVGTVGTNWRQPSFGELDAAGKLWVCDVSANCVRVFLPDGTEAPFSPISEGRDGKNNLTPIRTPAGVTITPNGEALISISARYERPRYSGLFRYRAENGKVLPGLDLPYFPGDADTDAQGLIYVVDKLSGQWHIYTPEGKEMAGSPFGQNAGLNVVRGLSVAPDGSRVYLISENSHDVRIWKGKATPESARYEETGTLVRHLSYESSSVDVMNDGMVLVSFHEEGAIAAYDAANRLLGQISGGPVPSLSTPRGVAFRPDGKTLWIINRAGQVQRWDKIQ